MLKNLQSYKKGVGIVNRKILPLQVGEILEKNKYLFEIKLPYCLIFKR